MAGGKLSTSLGRVRGLGSARSGTGEFWRQRLTAVAGVPLTIAFVVIVVGLLGRNHAAVVQILGSPFVAVVMLLFITSRFASICASACRSSSRTTSTTNGTSCSC